MDKGKQLRSAPAPVDPFMRDGLNHNAEKSKSDTTDNQGARRFGAASADYHADSDTTE